MGYGGGGHLGVLWAMGGGGALGGTVSVCHIQIVVLLI